MKRRSRPLRRSPLRRVSDRRRAETAAHRALVRQAMDRARGRCERCGYLGSDPHHLWPSGRAGKRVDELWNVAILCRDCHRRVHDGDVPGWLARNEDEARALRQIIDNVR